MKIPNPALYRKSQATWPSSATPDYAGELGLIIHDGSFPYWQSSLGKTGDVPDDMLDDVDKILTAVKNDHMAPTREKFFQRGMAIYGHLVDGHFFARFLFDIDVAAGRRVSRIDLGMDRAVLYRAMLNAGLLSCEYHGNVWLAPSVAVLNDAQFGRQFAKWQGRQSLTAQNTWNGINVPKVRMNGALLTDTFVAWNAKHPISVRPDPLEENEDMFL